MESGLVGFIALSTLVLCVGWLGWQLVAGLFRGVRDELASLGSTMSPLRSVPLITQPPADPAVYDYDLIPWGTGDGFGYAIQRVRDSKMMSWQIHQRSQGFEALQVAGTQHHVDDLQAVSFHPPARLRLIPEPTNKFDPHAIAVWDEQRRHHAGYISRDEAERIGHRIAKGHVVECRSMWEIFKDGQRVSLRILILYQEAKMRCPKH